MVLRAAGIDLSNAVKVLFASGSSQANALVLDRLKPIFPELPLVVVSEFAPAEGEWIPYHIHRAPSTAPPVRAVRVCDVLGARCRGG